MTAGLLPSVVSGAPEARAVCAWCQAPLPGDSPRAVYCSKRCRQTAWRCRRGRILETATDRPLTFGYADPPYPGFAKRLYAAEATYAGEVDHQALIASLVDRFDGWALSTGAYALRELLPLCPKSVRVCAWVKPIGANVNTLGIHNCWEPLIVKPGRRQRPGKRDWLAAQPARGGGELIGRKPLAFCLWLFELMGMRPGDSLSDLFPGTGIVGHAWRQLSLRTPETDRGPNHDTEPLLFLEDEPRAATDHAQA